jgi:class I fructose-bisphosphate aldolase
VKEVKMASLGKRTRLTRLFTHGDTPENRLLVLPIDQGLEHGPIDFLQNPDSCNPQYQVEIGIKGGFSAIALHRGLAERHLEEAAGRLPLILKINGKTNIPSDSRAFSPLTSSVEEAVALGADAIGYTLYVGSPAQGRDIAQFAQVKREAERLGMPVVIWSYPRGSAIEQKGGKNSLYAVAYAARVAAEVGADIVKVNIPKLHTEESTNMPKAYQELEKDLDLKGAMEHVVAAASGVPVIIAGGGKVDDETLLQKAKTAIEAGAVGFIFGRNIWQRPKEEALALTEKLKAILRSI